MSKLITALPVDLSQVLKSLPEKSYVHSISLRPDNTAIDIVWENDDIKTGRTYPVEHHLRELESKSGKKNLWSKSK